MYGTWSTKTIFHILLSLVFLASVSGAQSSASEAFDSSRRAREAALAQCNGAFKGKRPNKQEFDQVLEHHQQWLRDYRDPRQLRSREAKQDPRRANLCGATLDNLDLSAVSLSGASLSAANLAHQNLTGADLWGADLSYIFATKAIFSKAAINTGTLEGAWLQAARLDNAILAYANLRGAFLLDTNLREANIAQADLARAIYEPELGSLPHFSTLVTVKNLMELQFDQSPHALVELRQAFKNAGLRSHERRVTYAIKHNERLKAGAIESALNYLLFELTTEWGMAPARALRILALLIVVFTFPYTFALQIVGQDGIWRVWSESRLRRDTGQESLAPLRVGWMRAFWLGFYFSFLSAFHIGWREFNVGNWIARVQPSEYTYRATGWVRTMSGVQSLISVYLLAIWALTYFGRPFE